MPPGSPRKSSTSSAEPSRPRARYLGLEVAGAPDLLARPPPWEGWLRGALVRAGVPDLAFRLVRTEGPRAVVRVPRAQAGAARRAWNVAGYPTETGGLRTRRTWGTLVRAKAWVVAARDLRVGGRGTDRRER